MQESRKCMVIAVATLCLHYIMYALNTCPPCVVNGPAVHTGGASTWSHNLDRQLSLAEVNLDLSTFPPLHTISRDGKNEKAIFTSMMWNITNDKGDSLQIPPYSSTKRYQLMVDVGLEVGSGLMCLLQEDNHTDNVLIGLESHPINFGLASHSMFKGNPNMDEAKKRMQVLPFAMSDTDKYVKFNENFAPACGSILETAKGAWWCALTSNVLHVPAVTMNTLLRLVPSNYDYHYLKVDVEGAEELVLLGGSDFVPRFRMISLEVNNGNPNRLNEASNDRVDTLLRGHGFGFKACQKKKSFDCHYAKSKADLIEAERLHDLAIYFTREKMTQKKCKQILKAAYY